MSDTEFFLNIPTTSQRGKSAEPDVYIFGIPFDSTCSYRPGTRFGPNALREAFLNIEINSSRYNEKLEDLTIEDLGNTRFTVNPTVMIDMVRKVTHEITSKNKQTAILGGEHLLTYASYTSLKDDTPLVVFDAHYDLRDEFNDTKFSHATFLHRVIDERGTENILHVGARGFSDEEAEFRDRVKLKSITGKELINGNGQTSIRDILSSFDNLYVSIDLDVLDPAFMPGVGTPEALGITSQQLMDLIYTMEDRKIKCLDLVELSPPYDNGTSASLAAKLLAEILIMNHRN